MKNVLYLDLILFKLNGLNFLFMIRFPKFGFQETEGRKGRTREKWKIRTWNF